MELESSLCFHDEDVADEINRVDSVTALVGIPPEKSKDHDDLTMVWEEHYGLQQEAHAMKFSEEFLPQHSRFPTNLALSIAGRVI
ncbi:hypothetical protein TNCT_697971 [Trichonephila clavata]|uniref:Uncharacterized protein n=1 Tax=Trichonephila clavata TaxID=2740835 RepID=A0A8X6GQV4_TRICU|nr:hypothetical protein TNCT_697971 [Trichonephila clavata]